MTVSETTSRLGAATVPANGESTANNLSSDRAVPSRTQLSHETISRRGNGNRDSAWPIPRTGGIL